MVLIHSLIIGTISLLPGAALAGWDPDRPSHNGEQTVDSWESPKITRLDQACRDTLADFTEADPELKRFIEKAYAYAVYPSITKGGIGLGGASGKGLLYEQGHVVGSSRASQFTIGAQVGAMTFRQVVFFKDRSATDEFKAGTFKFGASVAAIAASSGAASQTDYSHGVATFTLSRNGAMLEAAVGGMKFTYHPLGKSMP